jgi:hypothetical protein
VSRSHIYYGSSGQRSAVFQIQYPASDPLCRDRILNWSLEFIRTGITVRKNKYEDNQKKKESKPNLIFWKRSFVISRGQNHKPGSLDSYTAKTAKMQKML